MSSFPALKAAAAATLLPIAALLHGCTPDATPPAEPRITPQTSGATTLLQAAHAANEQVVWASGHGGAIVRTLNGGETWERISSPAGDSLEFRDVHALNADTAWIMSAGSGSKSRIYHTTDGGAKWTLQFINNDPDAFYDCFTMFNASTGVAYSDATGNRTRILRTDNGGETWSLLDSTAVPAPLDGEGAFAASGLCVTHSAPVTAWIATGAPAARLFRSTDAGKSWQATETPFVSGAVAGLTGLSFIDSNTGVAVAADISRLRNDTSSNTVGITRDGGSTWELLTRPPLPGSLAGITIVPAVSLNSTDMAMVAVGYGGAFWSNDTGHTWHTITSDIFTGATAAGRTAWITGADGRILRLDW